MEREMGYRVHNSPQGLRFPQAALGRDAAFCGKTEIQAATLRCSLPALVWRVSLPQAGIPTRAIMTAETGRTQIRGSALLLGGKGISALLNFGTQVLIARQLTKGDYGAFIYALSAVAFFQVFCTLGMQVAIPRFVPIYDERRDYNKVFGAIAVAIGT